MRGADRTRSLLALTCMIAAGCYSYKPVLTPSPGDDVRARLTAEAAVWHSQGLEDPTLHYDGLVVEATGDTLVLDVLVARSSSAFQDVEIRDTVRLGNGEIQSILGRQLSVTKSVVFTVAAGVIAYAVIRGIEEVVGGTGDEDGNGTPGLRVPGRTGLRLQFIVRRSP